MQLNPPTFPSVTGSSDINIGPRHGRGLHTEAPLVVGLDAVEDSFRTNADEGPGHGPFVLVYDHAPKIHDLIHFLDLELHRGVCAGHERQQGSRAGRMGSFYRLKGIRSWFEQSQKGAVGLALSRRERIPPSPPMIPTLRQADRNLGTGNRPAVLVDN